MRKMNIWPFKKARTVAPGQVISVPSDNLLILGLALPKLAPYQRNAAALFAAEHLLAQPVEEMSVVVGPQISADPTGPWLVVIMASKVFEDLMAKHGGHGARLVPDVLLVPRPHEGQWTVARQAERLLARQPDGTGFATSEAGFRALWVQSGRPGLVWHHGTPLPDLPAVRQSNLPLLLAPEPPLATFDLAGDRLPDWRHPSRLAALAAVLLLGFVGYTGLLAFENHRLSRSAQAGEAQLREALTDRGIPVGTSVDATAAEVLHNMDAGQSAGFIALLSYALDAMADQSGSVTLQDISYDNPSGRLSLTLVAPELGALQEAATLLGGAGFRTDLGTSTISDGQARATVNLTRGAAG
jgi:general secretion pathway protein L